MIILAKCQTTWRVKLREPEAVGAYLTVKLKPQNKKLENSRRIKRYSLRFEAFQVIENISGLFADFVPLIVLRNVLFGGFLFAVMSSGEIQIRDHV